VTSRGTSRTLAKYTLETGTGCEGFPGARRQYVGGGGGFIQRVHDAKLIGPGTIATRKPFIPLALYPRVHRASPAFVSLELPSIGNSFGGCGEVLITMFAFGPRRDFFQRPVSHGGASAGSHGSLRSAPPTDSTVVSGLQTSSSSSPFPHSAASLEGASSLYSHKFRALAALRPRPMLTHLRRKLAGLTIVAAFFIVATYILTHQRLSLVKGVSSLINGTHLGSPIHATTKPRTRWTTFSMYGVITSVSHCQC
jgi:hypothetical protein